MSFPAFTCPLSSWSALMVRARDGIQNENSDLAGGGSTVLAFKIMLMGGWGEESRPMMLSLSFLSEDHSWQT